MIAKNCNGLVPMPGVLTPIDGEMLAEVDALPDQARAAMKDFALHDWLGRVWRSVGAANRYFTAEEPWVKRKTDRERMETILYVTAETLRNIAILVQPAMPASMCRLARPARPGARCPRLQPYRSNAPACPRNGIARAQRDLPPLCRGGSRQGGPLMLTDSHCHLDFPEFAAELPAVLDRARLAGVGRFITISTRVARFAEIEAIARRFEDVFFTVGTHPLQAAEEPDVGLDRLVELARAPKCVGIGEAGLDYHYDPVQRDLAARVFRTHIAAARATGLPLVIHARDADADMAAILEDEMGQGAFTAVLHCFTSSRALCETGLKLGLYVSFSGVVTFKNSAELRAIAADVPVDRMLVETDAPFLAPVPYRGKRNEPAFVAETARTLAALKGLGEAEFAAATSANVERLFSKIMLSAAVA